MSVLHWELEDRGLEVLSGTDLSPGTSVKDRIRDAIRSADLVIGVLVSPLSTSNVLFELGMAAGLRRSILLIADRSVDIPFDLQDLPIVWGGMSALEAIRFQLDQLIASRARPSPRRSEDRRTIALGWERAEGFLTRLPTEDQQQVDLLELESLVLDLFEETGAQNITRSLQTDFDHSRPDFALWSDALEGITGNPLVAELKVDPRPHGFDQARASLAEYVGAVGARWGLLLYLRGPIELQDVAPVLQIRLDQLIRELGERPLEDVLRLRRNKAVHGSRSD